MPSAETLISAIRELRPEPVKLMEVCGTHTHAIARAGIRTVLPEGVELLSGPGCPVCVTPAEVIDQILDLSMEPGVILTSYGDMLRVPGSTPGDSLLRRRALGARVEIVYSPMDAIEIAKAHPEKEVVFLGVGFETTAPGTAAAALSAGEQGVKNFSVWSMLKLVEPALRALMAMDGFSVQGFLCPGHVATIIGEKGFRFLPEEYGMPAVISGFEPLCNLDFLFGRKQRYLADLFQIHAYGVVNADSFRNGKIDRIVGGLICCRGGCCDICCLIIGNADGFVR